MTLKQAIARIDVLEAAIRKHAAQRDDDLCWENDDELYAVLVDCAGVDRRLAPLETRMANCLRYNLCRERGQEYKTPDRIADLEQRVEELELHQGEPMRIGHS